MLAVSAALTFGSGAVEWCMRTDVERPPVRPECRRSVAPGWPRRSARPGRRCTAGHAGRACGTTRRARPVSSIQAAGHLFHARRGLRACRRGRGPRRVDVQPLRFDHNCRGLTPTGQFSCVRLAVRRLAPRASPGRPLTPPHRPARSPRSSRPVGRPGRNDRRAKTPCPYLYTCPDNRYGWAVI